MLKHLILILFAVNACACTQPHTPTRSNDHPSPERLTARIDSFMQRNVRSGFNGTLLVVQNGQPILEKGYGLRDREKQLPNTPNTVHAIGSITKQFTAACVMKLQEQGKLAVQDPIGKYFKNAPADKSVITLHQLLTHSAGFTETIGDDYEHIKREAFVERAMKSPLEFAPGRGFLYTNVGYSLLGTIVEQVSGMSYERFLNERLLKPAGCTHTGYLLPDWSHSEMAIGYTKDGQRWGTMNEQDWAADGPYWNLRCNGGIMSTARDMYNWVEALHDHTVLDNASIRQIFTPHVKEEGDSHYGYGWAIFETPRGTRLIAHNGGNGVQFADVLWYADEGVTIVLLSNASARGMQETAWKVGRMVFDPEFDPQVGSSEQPLEPLPDGPQGERLKALSAIIQGGDRATTEAFLKNNLGPGFLSDMPLQEHMRMFQQMQKEIGKHSIEGVQRMNPEEFILLLRSDASKKRIRVQVQLRPKDALISGLGVEMGE